MWKLSETCKLRNRREAIFFHKWEWREGLREVRGEEGGERQVEEGEARGEETDNMNKMEQTHRVAWDQIGDFLPTFQYMDLVFHEASLFP